MRVTTKITWSMLTGDVLQHDYFEYDGPIEKLCGATSGQKKVAGMQTSLFGTLVDQAKSIFGDASNVFKSLVNTFAPTVAAGPSQQGFSPAELSARTSAAITNTGRAYEHARQAVQEQGAAFGGGNIALPSGVDVARDVTLANAGAEATAEALNKIDAENWETGRENYQFATGGLERAPSVFSAADSAAGAATGSGSAASQTQNEIAQANNSWVSAVSGALGGVAGAAVTGGLSGLGKRAPQSSSTPADFSGFTYEGP